MSTPFNYIVNPSVVAQGRYNAGTGLWTATLDSAIYNRDLTGISVQGPPSSQLKIYLGPMDPQNLIDQTQRGNSNTADYSGGPRHVPRGQIVTVVWSPLGGVFTGTETVAATFFVKQSDQ